MAVLTMNVTSLKIFTWLTVVVMVILSLPFSYEFTTEQDVYAINNLYVALGSPPIPGWIPNGGDPCVEGWQGVQCIGSNISSIILNGANLGGELGDKLGSFASIITIDLSNNHIGGSIPDNLPLTMSKFFLSANQFSGSIPSTLAELVLLLDMSVNANLLTGELPDAFQSLTGLINLDLSSNNLSGKLPPSMGSLSSLTTLHIQNNQLSGALDVLQDLPIKDLNIENNLFSGPIPEKMLSIPTFKKDGNPFNTTIAPSVAPSPMPLPPPAPLPFSGPAPHSSTPANSSVRPSAQDSHQSKDSGRSERNGNVSTLKIIGLLAVAICGIVVIVLIVMFCISKFQERKSRHQEIPKRQERRVHEMSKGPERNEKLPERNEKLPKPKKEIEKVTKEAADEGKEHKIDLTGADELLMPPVVEKVIVKPVVSTEEPRTPSVNLHPPTSATSFSVASLQQYTNSFSEENLIMEGRLGKVYLAELPDGKLLTVMKLDNVSSNIPVDRFLELVLGISELQHPNILELVGYCAEFGQRLLVHNYFSRRTLHDVLHSGDDLKKKLSWNARIQVALEAAKALEYLHEGCQPPVIHQNFEPTNVLIDEELSVRISDCGLASLMSSNSVTQLSGRLRTLFSYEAPEINESGSYSVRSDVYSFGVVMLELLTGRTPYDGSRPRPEQHLVRWASSQLHEINALSRMVDPSIAGKYPVKSLSRFADIISRCIQGGPEFRPPMSEVVQDLARMAEETKKRFGDSHQDRSKYDINAEGDMDFS